MRESSTLPYHRTDPNHRSIVSAIAVQATLVTTRNTKPKPNIASARYSVPTVPPTPTNKAHAIRPMRRMFSWKRRFILGRAFGGAASAETTNYTLQYYISAEAICNVITTNYKRARRLVWANTTHSRCRLERRTCDG